MTKFVRCDKCGKIFEETNGTLEINGVLYDICGECFKDIIEFVKGGKE